MDAEFLRTFSMAYVRFFLLYHLKWNYTLAATTVDCLWYSTIYIYESLGCSYSEINRFNRLPSKRLRSAAGAVTATAKHSIFDLKRERKR